MPLLTVSNVQKLYGADQILASVSFAIERGEHVALVGANGSGKTTLLRIITGLDEPESGQVSLARNALVTYVSQHARFESDHTLWDAMLEVFAGARDAQARMREMEREMTGGHAQPELSAEYHHLSAIAEHAGYSYEHHIERILSGLDLPESDWRRPVSLLSGGQKTRANLARALLYESDLLLLDEPTNHLDIAAINWLESFLRGLHQSFIIVAHDRYFLESTSTRTLELEGGEVVDYPASYLGFLRLRDERRARGVVEYERQQEHVAATEDFVRRFGAGQRSKEARGRQKRLDRLERVERPREAQALKLRMEGKARKGDAVLQQERLAIGYGESVLAQGPDNLVVQPGARIAVVGPNGAGKTTLVRTLIGQIPPLRGSYQWAPGVVPSYSAQATTSMFPPGKTLLQTFMEELNINEGTARTFLGQFLFTGDDVCKDVGDLSGGERSRLALATLLYRHPTVMVLDEPTNHLDIAAREALESALKRFGGTLILVSHDRFLINELASEIWSLEDGKLQIYDGNWEDFEARRFQRPLMFSAIRKSEGEVPPSSPVDASNMPPQGAVRPRAVVCDEMMNVQAEVATVVRELSVQAATASVDDLSKLVDHYQAKQENLAALTAEMVGHLPCA